MQHRYARVLALTIVVLVITTALPAGPRTGGAIIALQGALLIATVAATPGAGGRLTQASVGVGVVAGVAAVFGGIPGWLVVAASALFLVAAIVILARGTLALLSDEGVRVPTVAAALSIYLMVGLLFATVIGVIASVTDQAYFAQGTDGSQGDRVYFSFATLTTTGFGDLSAALPVGRALAVAEMLIGQIYLVTVVALLVGNLRPSHPAR